MQLILLYYWICILHLQVYRFLCYISLLFPGNSESISSKVNIGLDVSTQTSTAWCPVTSTQSPNFVLLSWDMLYFSVKGVFASRWPVTFSLKCCRHYLPNCLISFSRSNTFLLILSLDVNIPRDAIFTKFNCNLIMYLRGARERSDLFFWVGGRHWLGPVLHLFY